MKPTLQRALPAILLMLAPLTGCRYGLNRNADFLDIFQFGLGLTTENPKTGMFPPSAGIYIQATEFINLGALTFHGKTAEWDGRGFFTGFEDRTRLGLLTHQEMKITQNYTEGSENYFKKSDTLWGDRMNSTPMRWGNAPAKDLHYEQWSVASRRGKPIFYRGWHYWENLGIEIAIPEPLITHWGILLRFGFDPSEIFDFVLGVFNYDFKHDDLTRDEYDEFLANSQLEELPVEYKPATD